VRLCRTFAGGAKAMPEFFDKREGDAKMFGNLWLRFFVFLNSVNDATA